MKLSKFTPLFVLLLALASVLLVACNDLNNNPLLSGCKFNQNGTPSYCRIVVVYNETANGLTATPSINGFTVSSALEGIESLQLGIDLPDFDVTRLQIHPDAYDEYIAANLRSVQVESRINSEGHRTLRSVANGQELFTAVINPNGAEMAIDMLMATNVVLSNHQYTVETLLHEAIKSQADVDIAFILPSFFGTGHLRKSWDDQIESAKNRLLWAPPSSYLAAAQAAADQAAVEAAKVIVTIGNGDGPWSVAQKAAEKGKDFTCVFDLLVKHQKNGGAWRAGHTFEILPGTCDGGPTQLGAPTVLGSGN